MSGRVEATGGGGGGRPVARGLAEILGLYGVESGGPGRGNTKEIHLITRMRGMIGCRRSDLRKGVNRVFDYRLRSPTSWLESWEKKALSPGKTHGGMRDDAPHLRPPVWLCLSHHKRWHYGRANYAPVALFSSYHYCCCIAGVKSEQSPQTNPVGDESSNNGKNGKEQQH